MRTSTIPQKVISPINPSAAVTGVTTSSAIPMQGVRKASIFYTRASGTAGDSTLTVLVSGDDTNFIADNLLISNVTNDNTQHLTRVASLNLATNTTGFLTMDLDQFVITSMKLVSTNNADADDGVVKAKVVLEYY